MATKIQILAETVLKIRTVRVDFSIWPANPVLLVHLSLLEWLLLRTTADWVRSFKMLLWRFADIH
jgi:hypothetical protein